jgi:GntR family transcriptional repressor for pyruvate dehydrogenase complex
VIKIFNSVGNKELLSHKVAAKIEEAIVAKKIPPGDRLPSEMELCSQFGVSRTAVREALRTLSAKGMISIEKGRGIYVKSISSEHVSNSMHSYLEVTGNGNTMLEVIEARIIIEPAIAEYAALHHQDEDIIALRQNLEEMRLNTDKAEHAKLDMKFHLLVAEASGNNIMPLILNPIHRLMPNIKKKIMKSVPGAKEAALIWHKKVIEAIESRDPLKAYSAMKGHLEVAKQQTEQIAHDIAPKNESQNIS